MIMLMLYNEKELWEKEHRQNFSKLLKFKHQPFISSTRRVISIPLTFV